MIDLHTHILPGLDDGAENMAEALEMARIAVADGVHTMVATPHIGLLGEFGWKEVLGVTNAVREALAAEDIPLRLLPGAELLISPDLAHSVGRHGELTLGGTRYVLVELPMQQYPIYTEQTLFELQLKGFIPILAHPERNNKLQADPDVLGWMVQRGIMTQVTAGSLLGDFGAPMRQTAEAMVTRRMAHFIASDSHGPDDRPPRLMAARERAAKLVGDEAAMAMVSTNPAKLLSGQLLPVPEPEVHRQQRR
jgi:protein-tyrosine phosphatase